MNKPLLFLVIMIGGLFSANAADMIILKDGNVIDAKIMEIHPNEIRYKRADNLNGPMIFLPKDGILSIRYENGVVEVINTPSSAGQASGQTAGAGSSGGQQMGAPTPLQTILNTLPAIRIAGNNLKFQFGGDSWTATVNGENFWAGTIELEDTGGGSILNLKQTHMWPGAVGKTAGRLAKKIPGGNAVGGALDTAGNIAGKTGAVEVSGPVIVLEYKAGPPEKLSYLRSTTAAALPSENPDSGKRYEVVVKKLTWTKAKAEAEKRGGYLAVITSAEEQETIEKMISTSKQKGFWIGGFREGGVYKWVNNEPMNYTNWQSGEPNNVNGTQDKMLMHRDSKGKAQWADDWDSPMMNCGGYIIEWD